MLKRPVRALAALGLCGLTGCFVYVPAEMQGVAAGETLRVRVSRSASAEIAEVVPGDDPVVRGTLVRREQDRLFLRVPVAMRGDGLARRAITQDVAIPAGEILELERRRKSSGRTALFAVGTAAVVGSVIGLIVTDGRDRVIRNDGPPDEIRIPLAY